MTNELNNFLFSVGNEAQEMVDRLMEDYAKIDPDIKMKEYKYGIIYIRGKDEFQMQDINTAFDYIPDETNDCVIYTKEPVPIEIGVKPVKKELLYEEE